MKFGVMQAAVMAGELGDIFWDLAPYVVYSPGYDIGCNIYVANPTDTEKEYALMARLNRDSTLISEETLPVFGYTWFKVAPGDFVTLKGALRFGDSNANLTVSMVERESQAVTDSVATTLIAPTTSALPPAWPGTTTTTTTTWSSMLGMMMPMLMFGMLGIVMVSAFRPKEEKKEVATPIRAEERLPLGRRE
jgi:hypothetical protein